MRLYKYRLTIKNDDSFSIHIIDTKNDICKLMNISMSALNSILSGKVKHKYNFLTIERIYMPPNIKGFEDEYKKAMQRERSNKFLLKKKILNKDAACDVKDNLINKLQNINALNI